MDKTVGASERAILHEQGSHWVADAGRKGFAVYRSTSTHSVLVASVGRSLGLARAIEECKRREAALG